ncbi:BRCT domain protein [Reticulomyxa filosa]|uniref:BRCT domain protein n=1 Tax=Reticulomyxa filosa TaxID=46433 RepID=X6NK54_RETFI|nr:BRCT domain protein [Reticulomyxa filosa]|eukprot:ETO26109.1 BRCT domain protein [Reticulomyxa filosa]
MAQQEHTHKADDFVQLYLLTVHLIKGANLPVGDLNKHKPKNEQTNKQKKGGTSDPFVVTKIFDDEWKTDVVERNINPQWNESKTFCFVNPPQRVEFRVQDKVRNETMQTKKQDTFTKDDLLGTSTFECSENFQEIYSAIEEQQKQNKTDVIEESKRRKEVSRTLALQNKDGEPCNGTIDVSITCEVLLPFAMETRLTELKQQYAVLNETLGKLHSDSQDLNNQLNEKKARFQQVETEVHCEQQLNEKIAKLEEENGTSKDKVAIIINFFFFFFFFFFKKKKVLCFVQYVAELEKERHQLNESINGMTASENDLNKGADALEHEKDQLNQRLQKAQANLAQLQEQLQAQATQQSQFQREKDQLQATINELKTVGQSLREELTQLQSQQNQLEAQKKELQSSNETNKKNIEYLETQLGSKTQEDQQLSALSASLTQEINQTQSEQDSILKELEIAKQQLADVTSQLKKQSNDRGNIQNENQNLKERLSQQINEKNRLRDENSQLQEENNSFKEKLSSAKGGNDTRLQELEGEINKLQLDLAKVRTENEQLRDKMQGLEEENTQLKTEVQKFEGYDSKEEDA